MGARDAAKEAPQAGAGARLCLDRRPVRRLLPSRPRRPPRSRPTHGVGDRGARGHHHLHPLISAASTAPPIEDGAGAAAAEDEALKNDAYTATTYGDLEKMQRLVEGEGRSVREPDGGGYHALQWAALNNRVAAAQYILEVWFPTILLGA